MRRKFILVIILGILIVFLSGVTYSLFNSSGQLKSSDQGVASFVFEANNLEKIDLNLDGLVPGDVKEYTFSVTNNKEKIVSDVTVEYELIIKTYHFIPLVIELYNVNGDDEKIIKVCDETSSRNEENELVCKMPIEELVKSKTQTNDYKLKLIFPEQYNSILYSNLVDYISIEIDSWQKI